MTTKRIPIARRQILPITAKAIALYWRMLRIKCTVAPYTDWRTRKCCANCRMWWDLHAELDTELQNKPWEWPAIRAPCRYRNESGQLVPNGPNQRMMETARRIREASRAQKAAAKAARPQPEAEPHATP
jgi:hypothetical protein